MIKNMNNGAIKNDNKNKQSCNDWIIYGNKTRILKFLFATLRILKRSSQQILFKSYCSYNIIVIFIKSFSSLFVLNLGFSSSRGLLFLFIVIVVQNNYNNEINTYKACDAANLHTL